MPLIEDSLAKFKDLEPEIILTVDSDEVSAMINKIAQKYKIDFGVLSSLLIFLTVGDLADEDFSNYFKDKLGIGDAMTAEIIKDFQETIVYPLKRRFDFLDANPDKSLPLNEEKEILLNMFGKKLLRELNKHSVIADAINARVFYILSIDLDFKDELVRTLLSNEERVTSKDFLLDKKSDAPSIANWIQSFIKEYGSNLFDSVVLSKFLADSKNVKSLNEKEKDLVRKILLLYRNLKFFPESMPNDTGEGWEIIPSEAGIAEMEKARTVKAPAIEIVRTEPKKDEGEIERQAAELEAANRHLEELRSMAFAYPENSLQRKALEAEIKKLSKK